MTYLSFQVLKSWLERKRATSVQDLIETIRHWEKDGNRDRFAGDGYFNSGVWAKLREKVDLDSIQSAETEGITDIIVWMLNLDY